VDGGRLEETSSARSDALREVKSRGSGCLVRGRRADGSLSQTERGEGVSRRVVWVTGKVQARTDWEAL
jgi:hypothetical protein